MDKETELQQWRMKLQAEARHRSDMLRRGEAIDGYPRAADMQVTLLTEHYLKLAEFALAHIEHELGKIYYPQG